MIYRHVGRQAADIRRRLVARRAERWWRPVWAARVYNLSAFNSGTYSHSVFCVTGTFQDIHAYLIKHIHVPFRTTTPGRYLDRCALAGGIQPTPLLLRTPKPGPGLDPAWVWPDSICGQRFSRETSERIGIYLFQYGNHWLPAQLKTRDGGAQMIQEFLQPLSKRHREFRAVV